VLEIVVLQLPLDQRPPAGYRMQNGTRKKNINIVYLGPRHSEAAASCSCASAFEKINIRPKAGTKKIKEENKYI